MPDSIVSSCGTWDVTWPYPQAIFGKYYTLAFAAVAAIGDCTTGVPAANNSLMLFEMYCNTSDVWTASYGFDLGAHAYIDQVDILDFGPFYAVSAFGYNGNTPVITCALRLPDIAVGASAFTAIVTSQVPDFISGCNFNGQAVIGGISSSNALWEDRGLGSVCWSKIGSFDFRPGVVAGYRDMEWGEYGEGIVYKVRKLGNFVVVFGDGGVVGLIPTSKPVTTFGYKNLPGAGVRSGNHVAGDEHVQGFIDSNYDFWLMDARLQAQKLGYREWFKDLLEYTHVSNDYRTLMSYVPSKKRFYISNGNECYVLNEWGLYECNQRVTSAGDYRGKLLCGFFSDNADYEWRLETNELDFKQRGLKTLQNVEVAGRYVKTAGSMSTRVKYKNNDLSATWSALSWIPLNPKGIAFPIVSGSEFRVGVKGTDYREADLSLDEITMRVKLIDKTNVRGLYNANKAVS